MKEVTKEQVEKFKKVFFENCGYYPTDAMMRKNIKDYIKASSYKSSVKQKLKQLKYLLEDPHIYKRWKSSVVPIFEDLEAFAKRELEFRKERWGD